MRIITLTCPNCGTIIADNVLESNREFRCPGIDCEEMIRFEDLPESDKNYILDNIERYNLE